MAQGEPKPAKADKDVAALSFEDALAELERIVRKLEEGGDKLDDAIGAYERGIALKKHCESKLSEAKAKVDRITLEGSEPAGLEPAGLD